MAQYKVAVGTQVNVGGVVHKTGETFEAHPGQVREAVLLGWATPIDKKKAREASDGEVVAKE